MSLFFFPTGFLSEVIGDNNHHQTVLKGWLDKVVDPDLRWVNCYRASEHGWNASIFHARCDFKGPSVTLVRVKDFVFGGFTDQDWGGESFRLSIRLLIRIFIIL